MEAEDLDPALLGPEWEMAKMVMDSNYEVINTSIMADLTRGPEKTFELVLPTYEYCLKILPTQQSYIDLWREIFGSGLLSTP